MKTSLFVLILCFSAQLFAQRIIVSKSQTQEKEIIPSSKRESERIALKWNLATMLIGDFHLSLEYAIKDWLTLEAGMGMLTGNYISENVYNHPLAQTYWFKDSPIIMNCNDCNYQNNLGLSWSAKAKAFPSQDFYDGFYLALAANGRPYSGNVVSDGQRLPWRNHMFTLGLNMGLQYDSGHHLLYEGYVGAAYGIADVLYQDPVNVPIKSSVETQNRFLWINVGLLVGLIF